MWCNFNASCPSLQRSPPALPRRLPSIITLRAVVTTACSFLSRFALARRMDGREGRSEPSPPLRRCNCVDGDAPGFLFMFLANLCNFGIGITFRIDFVLVAQLLFVAQSRSRSLVKRDMGSERPLHPACHLIRQGWHYLACAMLMLKAQSANEELCYF